MAADKAEYVLGWGESGQDLLLMKTVATARTGFPKTTNINATPACLIPSGSSTPVKFCSSGWRPQNQPHNILDNGKWTELVRRFSAVVGFRLGSHIRDVQNTSDPRLRALNAGRFHACHAEKKLGLYFLTQQIRHANISLNDALHGRLRHEDLPQCRRRAKILLGHKPCKNCLDFLKLIRHRTGIDVRTESCAVFDRHIKNRTFYDSQAKQAKELHSSENIDSSDTEIQDEQPITQHAEQIEEKQPPDGWESRISEFSLDEEPVFGSQRHDWPTVVIQSDSEEDGESIVELGLGANGEPEPPLPALQVKPGRMSVLSTPSPSIPAGSLPGSSPVPRRLRFTPFSASPPRFGGTGAPPAHWGPRGKPPPTPCFVAPASVEDNTPTFMEPSLSNSSVMPSMAPQVSYFFASASPEPAAGQAEASSGTSRQRVDLLGVPETPLLAQHRESPCFRPRSLEDMPSPLFPARSTQHKESPCFRPTSLEDVPSPRITVRSTQHKESPCFRPTSLEDMPSPLFPARSTQHSMLPPPPPPSMLPPPPPPSPPPFTPVPCESEDVEFVLSMSTGSSPDTGGRTGAASQPWARSPCGTTAQRPLGVTPRDRAPRLDHPDRTGPWIGTRSAFLAKSRLYTHPSAPTPVIDLTAQPSSSAVFVRRPHPVPAMTSSLGRRLSERDANPPQQRRPPWLRPTLGGSRTPATARPRRQPPSFPDLQSYRFEV